MSDAHLASSMNAPHAPPMILYSLEPWSAFIADPQVEGLMAEHYEWARPAHQGRLEAGIDAEVYKALDAIGALKLIIARREGLMIGYCAIVIRRHLHYKALAAFEDVYFVTSSERGNGVGRGLLQTAKAVAANAGAIVSYWMTKEFEPQAKLLKSLGGEKFDSVYAIWLNEAANGN